LLVFACGLPVTLVNPYGILLWKTLLTHSVSSIPELLEWSSWPLAVRIGKDLPYCITLLLIVLLALPLAVRNAKRDLAGVLVLLATAILASIHIRHMPLFFLSFCVYVPKYMDGFFRGPKSLKVRGRVFFAALFLLMAAIILLSNLFAFLGRISSPDFSGSLFLFKTPSAAETGWRDFFYPVGALDYMEKNHISGNVLADSSWAGLVLWRLYPAVRTAIDGRQEMAFPLSVLREYWDYFRLRPGWRGFLEKYPHDMILTMAGTRRYWAIKEVPGWKETYKDEGCALFVRQR
jgi:hypothetical protein